MCGRTTLVVTADDLESTFGYEVPAGYRPTYNRAPGQGQLCLTGEEGGRLRMIEWGLTAPGSNLAPRRVINARGETVRTNRLFSDAFERRRCAVVVDGFYEWMEDPYGNRPHRVHRRDGAPFLLAAIWEEASAGAGVPTCAIVTTEASRRLERIHERMPVIIPTSEKDRWLSPESDPAELEDLLRPYEGEEIEVYEVSQRVNSTANDDPTCIRPVDGPEQLVLGAF